MDATFFAEYQRIFLTFHILAVVLGMGGATVADILFFNFLKDFKISKKETEVMSVLSALITAALLLLYVTGICLYLSDIPRFASSAAFFVKTLIVAVLTVNGILMHAYIAPRMIHLTYQKKQFKPGHLIHRLRAVAFAMGAVSFTSWYVVFFLSMLKRYLPADMTYEYLLGGYVLLLIVAIAGSQVLQMLYRRNYLLSVR